MKNGWTGGQYSLFRCLFGAYLAVHFVHLAPWAAELFSNRGVLPNASASPVPFLFPNILAVYDAPWFATALVSLGALLAVLFAAGKRDRPAAVLIWYIWACLFGRNPLIANPGLPYVGWMLLAHACLPARPYLSWDARGRSDPGGAWRMPTGVFAAAWVLMAVGYSYSGYTKLVSPSWLDGTAIERVLDNPLARPGTIRDLFRSLPEPVLKLMTWGALGFELLFAPVALIRRLRPWLWGVMLAMHLGLIVLIDFADLSLGMVMLHLFTFDPAWIRRRRPQAAETIFYDGHCGLCHRWVRFILAEDASGEAFRFAPLDSEKFRRETTTEEREGLPDSIVVGTASGELLVRSAAVVHILRRLGGVWRLLAGAVGLTPRRTRDAVYDSVASLRRRMFAAPAEACPVAPPELRSRFDA